MNRNPIVPFILIMVFGLGLMFFLSIKGLGDHDQLTKEADGEEKTEEVASANPEDLYKQSCIGCHGDAYQGGIGPALTGVGDRLSHDQIKDILINGKGSMPPGMVTADQADAVADWLATVK
jgi:cytochrome c550